MWPWNQPNRIRNDLFRCSRRRLQPSIRSLDQALWPHALVRVWSGNQHAHDHYFVDLAPEPGRSSPFQRDGRRLGNG